MQFPQQRFGSFVHGVAQSGCQGVQHIGAAQPGGIAGPGPAVDDADALVAHEALQAYRCSRQLMNALALGRQHHPAYQAQRHGVLGVAGQHAPHHQRAHGAGGIAEPGCDLRLGGVGQVVEQRGRFGAQ